MDVYFFHLMPWKELPDGFAERYGTAWITFPNTFYDPEVGQRWYNQYLDELEFAEELGFDGVCVNEHHQNAYGTMPSPNIMAACLARRTQRVRIAIFGNALPIRDHPLRVAEEVAMLDVVTGGRIISGFVRGIGCEYHSFNVNPVDSRERFLEAHDLIVKAWTHPGPFAWRGRHYNFRYVNVWPRPVQRPHPPIFLPSQGSQETIEWAAAPERRYPFLQTFRDVRDIVRWFDAYRACAARAGYEADPYQLGWAVPIYVGDTDAAARREAREAAELFFNHLLWHPTYNLFPPGYLSLASMEAVMTSKRRVTERRERGVDDFIETGELICGGPESVAGQLIAHQRRMGIGHLVGIMQFGNLSHEATLASLERFGRSVLPRLREAIPPTRWPQGQAAGTRAGARGGAGGAGSGAVGADGGAAGAGAGAGAGAVGPDGGAAGAGSGANRADGGPGRGGWGA